MKVFFLAWVWVLTCLTDLVFPIHICFRIRRDKMIMTMWDLESEKSRRYTSTSCCFLDGWCEFSRSLEYSAIVWLWYIREMIDLDFRYYDCMSGMLRENIEKRKSILIFIEFERCYFSGDDFGENGGHNYSNFWIDWITVCAVWLVCRNWISFSVIQSKVLETISKSFQSGISIRPIFVPISKK